MEGEFTKKNTVFPQQSLLALVSSTPPEFQVQISDEYLEDGPFADPADIIGVSFMAPPTLRTYQIGDKIQNFERRQVRGSTRSTLVSWQLKRWYWRLEA